MTAAVAGCAGHAVTLWTLAFAVCMVVVLAGDAAEAKRGCSAFGHSCYGGHGKRMDTQMATSDERILEGTQRDNFPEVVFTEPRSSNQDEEPQMRQQFAQELYNLSPFLRQWLQAYRNSQNGRRNTM